MDSLIYLIKSIVHNIPMIGGAVFCLIILSIYFTLKLSIPKEASKFIESLCDFNTKIFFVVYILMGIFYLAYPNYLSHVEPTVAWHGVVLKGGSLLYLMPVGSYPYYGIIYGPALSEIQLLFQWLGFPTLVSSKLPGLMAFAFAGLILLRLNKDWLYRGYLLYLFPFGLMLFHNRAEPYLLLIVSISILISKNCADKKYLPILMGLLGGVASALKIHGAAYVLAAYLAVVPSKGVSIHSLALFSISSALSFFAFFIPQNVSFVAFWGYLRLAVDQHGFSIRLLFENLLYLSFLFLPLFMFWREAKFERITRINVLLILIVELFITFIAAKNGAGFYHLMPLIPINVFIFQKIWTKTLFNKDLIKVLYASLIIASLITVLLDFVLPMSKSWRQFYEAKKEAMYFENKYPGILMGVTDDNGYPYSFLRVILKGEQIDYESYMDLQISGINDDTFAENLKNCRIQYILVPNIGNPFSLNNYYSLKPLFSENVRESFKSKYNIIEIGKHYSLYTCSPKTKSVP